MAGKKSGGNKIGRNADSGRFTTVKKAETHKKTHVVETLPKKKGK